LEKFLRMGLFSSKKGRERRKKRREERRQRRKERREERRAYRLAKKGQKFDFRSNRLAMRQDGRSLRAQGRQMVRATAYQNGMDPNKFISDSVGSVSQAAMSYFGMKGQMAQMNTLGGMSANELSALNLGSGNSPFNSTQSQKVNNNMLMYLGIGVVLVMLFNNRK
jgi:hypothetical protein